MADSTMTEGMKRKAFSQLGDTEDSTSRVNNPKRRTINTPGIDERSQTPSRKIFAENAHEGAAISDDGYNEDEYSSDDDEEEQDLDDNENEENSYRYDDEFDSGEEEYGEREYEVERYQLVLLKPPQCLLRLKVYVTINPEFNAWLQTPQVNCSYGGEVIGQAHGQLINRNFIRSSFYRNMEEPTQDMSNLAYGIFDRYGFLKKELKEHPVRKGTGAWGSELDVGRLFLIEYIRVDREWKRHGIGNIMAKALMRKANNLNGSIDFALAIPGWLNTRDMDADLKDKSKLEKRAICFQNQDIADKFWRSLGFRRIGASSCFGLAKDPSHKSHNISAGEDHNPEDPPQVLGDDNLEDGNRFSCEESMEEKIPRKTQETLRLHHAVNTLSDEELVTFFKFPTAANEVLKDEWRRVDLSRNNVLHIAACLFKPRIIAWVMEHVDNDKTLRLARNLQGYTPLEAIQAKLEVSRISGQHRLVTVCISDQFCGFPEIAIDCLGVLQGFPNPSGIRALRLKYGCTCGECLGGCLSPRMKFALLTQAEINYDMLLSNVDDHMWFFVSDHVTDHLAPTLQQNFRTNKSLRQGFTNMFDHIATCLRQNCIPTEDHVLDVWRNSSEWPPVTRNFLEKGGRVKDALRAVFDKAKTQDYKAGDGKTMEMFADDILKMPECRNDHEFGFVALACGL